MPFAALTFLRVRPISSQGDLVDRKNEREKTTTRGPRAHPGLRCWHAREMSCQRPLLPRSTYQPVKT